MQQVATSGETFQFVPGVTRFSNYRGRFQKISLSPTGEVPFNLEAVSPEEHSATLSSVASLWQLLTTVGGMAQSRNRNLTATTAAETWLAFKRWILSHHLFIPMLALIGYSLNEAVRASQSGRSDATLEWTQLGARMRRGCGALCIYGIDFEPCSEIYCLQIRSQMPPGFTGYEIRERQNAAHSAIAMFSQAFPKLSADEFSRRVRSLWMEADQRYHELHQRCMFMAVPLEPGRGMPESLRQEYLKENGAAHKITEEEFLEYDNWFGIERSIHVTRLDYVYQLCEVMERVLADLMVGHRLEDKVFLDLLDGMRAALVVFSSWAGSISNSSPFSHRYLRGE